MHKAGMCTYLVSAGSNYVKKIRMSEEKTQDLEIVSLSNGKGLGDAKRSRDSGMGATAGCVSLNLMTHLNPYPTTSVGL